MNLITPTTLFLSITCATFAQHQVPTELISERTESSATYLNPNGQKETVISAGKMHYQLNDAWLPIETNLIHTNDGRFMNETNTFKTSFPETISPTESFVLISGNDVIEISSLKEWISITSPESISAVVPFDLNGAVGSTSGNQLSYSHPSYSDQFEVEKGFLKNNVILEHAISILQNSADDYFGFQEQLILPVGWKIVAAEPNAGPFISSGLFVLDENGITRFTIPAPLIYEEEDPSTDGSSPIIGKYLLEQQNTNWKLSTLVPTNWLKDPKRNYPVIIDPTFTAGGADGGWMSAVNWVNNPSFVFVGVCCGNQGHRAWMQYNTTSINDAACVTNVELQLTLNGVGGAAPELTHAYDMTGTPGPYPAISAAVLADMVSGWYTSFTLGGVATYGYYDLGPSADGVLEGQLPINWYQVALVFDNEPSTNWKRFTASACNLRVTYLDPPCTLLPVELTSFSVNCEAGKAILEWSTASELNNDYFTIWRSNDGNHFEEIKRLEAVGNSQSAHHYSWTNEDESASESYYRLSQTDTDGKIEFFEVERFESCTDDLSIFQQASGECIVIGENLTSVSIRQSNGKVVFERTLESPKEKIVVPTIEAASGVYFVTVQTSNGEQFTKTIFVK